MTQQGLLTLSNEIIEIVAAQDYGPRIIHFGFAGSQNEFCELPGLSETTEWGEWRMVGGHRLWAAPERKPFTYHPDNEPVEVERLSPLQMRLVAPIERHTGIQKSITITLPSDKAEALIAHQIINRSDQKLTIAAWAISVMAGGGTGILPLPAFGSHADNLPATNSLALWAYTDLADPRFQFADRLILLKHQPSQSSPQKIGARHCRGWLGYANRGRLFVKLFDIKPDGEYPDQNSGAQLFVNGSFLELESLSLLDTLPPGGQITHTEKWTLFDGFPLHPSPQMIAEALPAFLLP